MIVVAVKLLIVLFFLIMFLRRPAVTWGVGLLTVSTALLLDALLGSFNRDDVLAEMGFFFYIIAGTLFAGAAFWLFGVLNPYLPGRNPDAASSAAARATPQRPPAVPDGYDRQMLYAEIHERFTLDDVYDLLFDLNINTLDVMSPGQTTDDLIGSIMDAAEREGKTAELALAVERILTPPLPEHLPRADRLSPDSPRTVVRHYVLANCDWNDLVRLSDHLGIDWEQLDGTNKHTKTRSLLEYLYHRDRIEELLATLQG